MVGVGRELCGSSSPTLLPKQGHLQQAAQDLVQAGLEYLQRRGRSLAKYFKTLAETYSYLIILKSLIVGDMRMECRLSSYQVYFQRFFSKCR